MNFYDVVLFAKLNFHLSCLKPISEELTKLGVRHLLTTKRHQVYDMCDEHNKKMRLMVICDEWANLFRENAEILVTTGHSLVSKNTTYSPKNKDMDYICAASQFQMQEFQRLGVRPKKSFWITGYPAADRIFTRQMNNDSMFFRKKMSPRPKILFCPTYNKELNLMDSFIKHSDNLCENLRHDGFDIAFKVHPVLPKKHPDHWIKLKEIAFKHGFYIEEETHADIADAILWADIVVGDCSGAMILATAANIPIILYDNPAMLSSGYFDGNGLEWIHRNAIGTQTSSVADIPHMIRQRSIFHPTEFRDMMFGASIDGRAGQRIAFCIRALL